MDDTKRLELWVLGGDGRYPWAVRALRENGLPVKTWGVPGLPDQAENPETALERADLALLPLKPFQGELIRLGQRTLEWATLPCIVKSGTILVAGEFPPEVEDWLRSQGIWCVGILDDPAYLVENAVVTAEGALCLAMEMMSRTLWGAEVLVIGWGRIGKFLAAKLEALGAKVTVAARREQHWAALESLGFRPEETGRYHQGLGDYDLIVNTVPAPVLTLEQLEKTKPGCCLLELASQPGGFPEEAAAIRETCVARGLPGKIFPQTAGAQLADAVWAVLTGERRDLE